MDRTKRKQYKTKQDPEHIYEAHIKPGCAKKFRFLYAVNLLKRKCHFSEC